MKKRITIICAAALIGAMTANSQEITSDKLSEIQSSFEKDAKTSAIGNILKGESNILKLSLNRDMAGEIDHYFKYKVKVKGITDQKQSGRCWMFTSMNVLRPGVMEKYNLSEFDFSHNYNYFWDIFEKSNLFLENVIATADRTITDRDVEFYFKSPVADGGVWNLFYNIAEKYGVVPQSVMPETAHSNDTKYLRAMLNKRLRAGGYALRTMISEGASAKKVEKEKMAIMKEVYRVLALCLGEPPASFEWRYKDKEGNLQTLVSTPYEFYKSIKPENYDPQAYIMIMNDPTREYYKVYEIINYKNTIEGINWVYLNLPNDVIKKAAIESIKNNEAMYASCDVTMYNSAEGICDTEMFDYESLLGINIDMDKKARILTRDSGSAHAMAIMAVDIDDAGNPVKWQFENSWGPNAGHKGYMTFTDRWFDEYMFRIVINKKYLDEKSIEASKSKPVMLPAWDYMF